MSDKFIWLSRLAFLFAVSLISISPASSSCTSGHEYCSIGTSKAWVGDIGPSSGLRSFLSTVPFKKEIIVSAAIYKGPQDPYGDLLLQLHGDLMNLGLAHHTFLCNEESDCRHLGNESQAISCVYDSGELKNLPEWIFGGHFRVWHQRIRFIARTIRLGYNVMLVDADTMFLSNPYIHLKNSPLKDIQFLCNPEGGGTFNCNGGFDYIHDVDPDGPISWTWFDIVRTTLLRADDHYNFSSKWTGNTDNCNSFDQACIGDSLVTAGVGRPLYYNSVQACKRTKNPDEAHLVARNGQKLTTNQAIENMFSIIAFGSRGKIYSAPPNQAWLDQLGWVQLPQIDAQMWATNVTVPNMNYGFPEELGGLIYPDTPSGTYSSKWIETLKNDCPSCPWFNDKRPLTAEDPLYKLFPTNDYSKIPRLTNETQLSLFIDPAVKKETFGNTPRWFASSLFSLRRGMALGTKAKMKNHYLSIGHIHYWFGQNDKKMILRKLYGAYNYTLGSELALRRNQTPYERSTPFDRVLMLDPRIDLSRIRDWNEFSSIITGLIQLAKLSHRVLVMPEVPCVAQWIYEKSWLGRYKNVCTVPQLWQDQGFQILTVAYPVDKESGELVGGWSRRLLGDNEPKETNFMKPEIQSWWAGQKMMTQILALISPACSHGFAIPTPDLYHWLKHSEAGKLATAKPSDSNTVFRLDPGEKDLLLQPPLDTNSPPSGMGGTVDPLNDQGWSWYDCQAAVSAKDAMREMHHYRHQPLVYIGHPVMVVPGEGGEEWGVDLDTGRLGSVSDPNGHLSEVNERIKKLSNCRAIRRNFLHKEDEGTVDLNHGVPSTIKPGECLKKKG